VSWFDTVACRVFKVRCAGYEPWHKEGAAERAWRAMRELEREADPLRRRIEAGDDPASALLRRRATGNWIGDALGDREGRRAWKETRGD